MFTMKWYPERKSRQKEILVQRISDMRRVDMEWVWFIIEMVWIAFMGIVPPAITSLAVGWFMYIYGRKVGERQYKMAKDEIRAYIKGEFLQDLTNAVRDQLNGIFGPVARQGTAEGKAIAAQYAQQNPNIASMLMSVASKGAARWLGKQLGVPKDVVDVIGGNAPFMPVQLGKRKDDDLQPVVLPGPQ